MNHRWIIMVTGYGALTSVHPCQVQEYQARGWQVLLKVNGFFTVSRRDFAYIGLVHRYRL